MLGLGRRRASDGSSVTLDQSAAGYLGPGAQVLITHSVSKTKRKEVLIVTDRGQGMRNAHRSLRVAFIHVSKCICIIKIGLDAHFHGCAGPLHCWSPMTVPKALFCAKNRFWREIESRRDAGEGYRRRSCQE